MEILHRLHVENSIKGGDAAPWYHTQAVTAHDMHQGIEMFA